MNERQGELPFKRREINALIERADLPSPRRGVIRAVLKEIVFFQARDNAPGYGPTHDHLAKRCGWSRRTIIRAIADAETLGVLTIEPVVGRDGRKANRYTVNRPALGGYGTAADLAWDGCQDDTGQVTRWHMTGDTVAHDTCQGVTAFKEKTSKTNTTNEDQYRARAPTVDPGLAKPVAGANARRRRVVTVDDVAIPPEIDTPELREALSDWLEHHADRCPQTYKSGKPITCILRRIVADHGPRAAAQVTIDAIAIAIGANYQGFYWGKKNGGKTDDHGWGPGQVYRAGQNLGDV